MYLLMIVVTANIIIYYMMYKSMIVVTANIIIYYMMYKSSFVYCRELAPGAVRLTGDRIHCGDSKHYKSLPYV